MLPGFNLSFRVFVASTHSFHIPSDYVLAPPSRATARRTQNVFRQLNCVQNFIDPPPHTQGPGVSRRQSRLAPQAYAAGAGLTAYGGFQAIGRASGGMLLPIGVRPRGPRPGLGVSRLPGLAPERRLDAIGVFDVPSDNLRALEAGRLASLCSVKEVTS